MDPSKQQFRQFYQYPGPSYLTPLRISKLIYGFFMVSGTFTLLFSSCSHPFVDFSARHLLQSFLCRLELAIDFSACHH